MVDDAANGQRPESSAPKRTQLPRCHSGRAFLQSEGGCRRQLWRDRRTIGHEISHSFDNAGAEFNSEGKLANWWTPEDAAHFKAASQQLVEEFNKYEPLPGLHLNGEQTLGENIADVAGLSAAYDAYKLSLHGKELPIVDGLTGDQRFFLAFAQSWRQKIRDAALRSQIVTNEHAPDRERAQTVRNIDPWYEAYAVKPGQKLYLKPEERVRIW